MKKLDFLYLMMKHKDRLNTLLKDVNDDITAYLNSLTQEEKQELMTKFGLEV